MNQLKLIILSTMLLLLHSHLLIAQNPSPHWAQKIYSSKGTGGVYSDQDLATDKQGNVYALYYGGGYIYADGQATPDSTANTVITSWDCNGNLRWMKSLGGLSATNNMGLYIETDTLGGICVAGFVAAGSASGSAYWDTDTAINLPAGRRMEYLIKYNSQGQFQWLRTPVDNSDISNLLIRLSVGPAGDVFWFALLDTGVYDDGAFTINTRKFYAIHYNGSGSFQSATPLDMTPPTPSTISSPAVFWKFDPATNRFYGWLNYNANYGTSLVVGNTPIIPTALTGLSSVAVLGAFNNQGQNLWVRQSDTNKNRLHDIAFGNYGTLYLGGSSEPGSIFCDDTATGTSGQYGVSYVMALDTNAGRLWSNYSANSPFGGIADISHANNTIVATGTYMDTLSWNNYILTNTGQTVSGYMLRADAVTGATQQLESIDASSSYSPVSITADRNDNVYISGAFQGDMVFANDSLSSLPPNWAFDQCLLKYKNATCGCDLLQPAFNLSNTGAATYQYTYTGGTPYSSISWDFGDGSTVSGVPNPVHTYSSLGTFPVCVTVTNSCGSNTTCKYATVSTTNIEDENSVFHQVNVYPNPAKDEITISNLPPGTTVEVWDVFGRRLKNEKSDKAALHITLGSWSPGMYLLRLTDQYGRRGSSVFMKK